GKKERKERKPGASDDDDDRAGTTLATDRDLQRTTHMSAEDAEHPYYQLLPSHVTREAIEHEKADLQQKLHETREFLRALLTPNEGAEAHAPPREALRNRHFRAIDTYFDLKHVLPTELHLDLIAVLQQHLFEEQGKKFGDIDLEKRATKALAKLLRKWKHRHPTVPERVKVSWRLVKASLDRTCFAGDGSKVPRAAQVTLLAVASAALKLAEAMRYFLVASASKSLVAELWEEFRPTIEQTSSNECFRALAFFSLFFVLNESTSESQHEIEQLLPEWLAAWSSVTGCTQWDGHWLKIMSRIAKRHPTLDWKPHLSFLFAKVHNSFDMPSDLGSPFKKQEWPPAFSSINGSKRFDQYAARLCIWMLRNSEGDGIAPATQQLLDLLNIIKAFFHPSNVANTVNSLSGSVYCLTLYLGDRIGREKGASSPSQLDRKTYRPLLDVLIESATLGIYSKRRHVASKCMYVIKNLIVIDPAHCATPILDEMIKALDPGALSQTHLAPTAIATLSVFMGDLMQGKHPLGTGLLYSRYLAPILRLTLPGIDANDERKTVATVTLYFHILTHLPLVNDVSKTTPDLQKAKTRSGLSQALFKAMEDSGIVDVGEYDGECDQSMWELGTVLEDWAVALMDRCFAFIKARESASELHPGASDHDAQGALPSASPRGEDKVVLDVVNMMQLLYDQLSPPLYTQGLQRTAAFITNSFSTSPFGRKVISKLVEACVKPHPAEGLAIFMPFVEDRLHSSAGQSLISTEKKLLLSILNGLVRTDGESETHVLEPYHGSLSRVLRMFTQENEEKDIQEMASKIMKHILLALLSTYATGFRSLPQHEWLDAMSDSSNMFQYLGTSMAWKNVSPVWHQPSSKGTQFALSLVHEHVLGAVSSLHEMTSTQNTSVSAWLRLTKRIEFGVDGIKDILVDPHLVSESNPINPSNCLLMFVNRKTDTQANLIAEVAGLKSTLMESVHKFICFWRDHGTGSAMEIQVWHSLTKIINELLLWQGCHLEDQRKKQRQNSHMKATTSNVVIEAMRKTRRYRQAPQDFVPYLPRNDMIDRVQSFFERRKTQAQFGLAFGVWELEDGQLYKDLLEDLLWIMHNQYESVRQVAQSVMNEKVELFSKWISDRIPCLLDVVEGKNLAPDEVIPEEFVLGTLNVLLRSSIISQIWKRRDDSLPRIIVALLKCNDAIVANVDGEAAKNRVATQFQTLFLSLFSSWRYVQFGDKNRDVLANLLKAEPSAQGHWKFQLMHLVSLYPFLQRDASKSSLKKVWPLVLKSLKHDVLPVRQIAVLLFSRLSVLSSQQVLDDKQDDIPDAAAIGGELVEALVNIHRSSNRFNASADGQHAGSAPSNWSFGVNEVVAYLSASYGAHPRPPPLSASRLLNQSADGFRSIQLLNLRLIKKLTRVHGNVVAHEKILNLAANQTDVKVADEERQAVLNTLAEYVGGTLRGLLGVDVPDEVAQRGAKEVVLVFRSVLPSLSVTLSEPWQLAFYYATKVSAKSTSAFSSRMAQRLRIVVDYLLTQLKDSFTRATTEDYARQVKWLMLLEPFTVHLLHAASVTHDASTTDIARKMVDDILQTISQHALVHQYKMVRDRVGKMLFILSAFAVRSNLVDTAKLPASSIAKLASNNASEVESTQESEHGEELRATETAMAWLMAIERHGEKRDFFLVVDSLFPVVFQAQGHSKAEVAIAAHAIVDAVAGSLRLIAPGSNSSEYEKMMSLIETLATNSSWKIRGGVLRFLAAFVFYHWIYWTESERKRVEELVSTLLTDPQRQVQEMAKFAMRGLIHYQQCEQVMAMSTQLIEEVQKSRIRHPKLLRRLALMEKDAAVEDDLASQNAKIAANEKKMVTSVLRMSAVILAFPYSVPEFVPPLCEEFGKYLYLKHSSAASAYLEKTVTSTLQEFKRTHQDNWVETKRKFDENQLAAIEDVMHPFYQLLPPDVTREGIDHERTQLLERVQDALARLQALRSSTPQAVEKKHFRAVSFFFSLKHVLPRDVHHALISELQRHLFVEAARWLPDVDVEVAAMDTLALLVTRWKTHHRDIPAKLHMDWRLARDAIERACWAARGHVATASHSLLKERAHATVECVAAIKSFLRGSTTSTSLVADLWTELGPDVRCTDANACFKALALFAHLFTLPKSRTAAAKGTDQDEAVAAAHADVARLLPEWLDTWTQIPNSLDWDGHWLRITSRVAKQCQSLDWTPYLPLLLAKIQETLDIPSDLGVPLKSNDFTYEYTILNNGKPFDYCAMRLCVYVLRPSTPSKPCAAMVQLLDLLRMTKPFFHPSNVVDSADALGFSVYYLTHLLGKRLGIEKTQPKTEGHITVAECQPLMDLLLEIAFMGIYSKQDTVSSKCVSVIRNLICIDPSYCVTPVLDEMMKALDPTALNQTHFAPAAISTLSTLISNLFCGRQERGMALFLSKYLPSILQLTLPGIDANDENKTTSTVMLYFEVLTWLPLVNDVSKSQFDLTKQRGQLAGELFREMADSSFVSVEKLSADQDQLLWELGTFLEEWALVLLDRCFDFIKARASAVDSNTHSIGSKVKGRGGKAGTSLQGADGVVLQVISMMERLYAQMGPSIYAQALRRTFFFVSTVMFPSSFGRKVISGVVSACSRANPTDVLHTFMPYVCERLHVTKHVIDCSSLMVSEKLWFLAIVDGLVRYTGQSDVPILKFEAEFRAILKHFLTVEDDEDLVDRAAKMLKHVLASTLSIRVAELRSLPPDAWIDATSTESGMFQYFGVALTWKHTGVSWRTPSKLGIKFAVEVADEHVVGVIEQLRQCISERKTTVKTWQPRLKCIYFGVRGLKDMLLDSFADDTTFSTSALTNGMYGHVQRTLVDDQDLFRRVMELKTCLMAAVHEFTEFWKENASNSVLENQVWHNILNIVDELLLWRGDHSEVFRSKESEIKEIKASGGNFIVSAMRHARRFDQPAPDYCPFISRYEMIEQLVHFYEKRKYKAHTMMARELFQKNLAAQYATLLEDAEWLMKHPYDDVRVEARGLIKEKLDIFTVWGLERVPQHLAMLEGGITEGDDMQNEGIVLGTVDFLIQSPPLVAMWGKHAPLLQRLLIALLKSNDTIVKRFEAEDRKLDAAAGVQDLAVALLSGWKVLSTTFPKPAEMLKGLLANDPRATEHWKFQLLHLACMYPFIERDQCAPGELWTVILRYLAHDVLPVRQAAGLLLVRLVKAAKHWNTSNDQQKGLMPPLGDLVQALAHSMLENHKAVKRMASTAESKDWFQGVDQILEFMSERMDTFPAPLPISGVRMVKQTRQDLQGGMIESLKLIQKLTVQHCRSLPSDASALLAFDTFQKIAGELDPKMQEEERQAALDVLGEYFGGSYRALLKTSMDDKKAQQGILQLIQLLREILQHTNTYALAKPWSQVIAYLSRPTTSGDQSVICWARLQPLAHFLLHELEESFVRAAAEDYARQAKWLILVEGLLMNLCYLSGIHQDKAVGEIATELCSRVLRVLREHALTHRYKMVRDRAGKLLFILSYYALRTPFVPLAGLPRQEIYDTAMSASEDASSGDRDDSNGGEESVSLCAKETALMWLNCCVHYGDTKDFVTLLPQVFSTVFQTQNTPKVTVAATGKTIVNCVAVSIKFFHTPEHPLELQPTNGATGPTDALDAMMHALESLTFSSSWKTRMDVLRFLSPFVFYHWLFLSESRRQRVLEVVSGLLADSQREVQEAAVFALRNLIHYQRDDQVRALSEQLGREAHRSRVLHSKLMRQLSKSANTILEQDMEALPQRIKDNERAMARSVLGLSAIVRAFPHTLPSYVPPLLEEMGKYLYSKHDTGVLSFLQSSVKDTLLEFKRTHQDNWADTKSKLTLDQLSVFEDVMMSPSYFT
ncbi:TPA: hypothetical protein N0F65_004873, partial [Lagenidium giganteum]